MKIVAINSSLSAYEPQRAILVGERIRGMSNRAYIPARQVEPGVRGFATYYHKPESRLDYQIMKGEKMTPIEKAKRNPLSRRYE